MFIVQVFVERSEDNVYFVGPFRNQTDAITYIENYHGELDNCLVIKLNAGLTEFKQRESVRYE
jgi:hypothetical protein